MGKLIPDKTLKVTPRHEAFSYQHDAFEAIRDLEYAAIFHEQGLGKTKIAVDLLLFWLEQHTVDTVLIVVKKGLIDNWRRELATHTFVRPSLLTQSRRSNFHVFNSPARIILTHFEVLRGEEERFKLFLKTRDVGVIVDESAKIKNPRSALTEAFLRLAPGFQRRVIMTGTPIANRPFDLWAQVHFLDQGQALGEDFVQFKKEMDLSSHLADDTSEQARFEGAMRQAFGKISAFSVRETKDSGIIELPKKHIASITTDWEELQYELYHRYRTELRATIVQEGIPSEDKADNVLKRLLRLIQVASNPRLVDEQYSREPGKFPYLEDLVHRIRRDGQKCIIWTGFNDNVDWLASRLKTHGTRKIYGKMEMAARNRSVEKFMNDPDTGILVATPGAAKEGLTLTEANHVIFYDRGFSLDDYLQSQDRIHRISQKQTCYVHNLLMCDSIDEWVDLLLRSKHLAAQLTQGDISLEHYRSQMSYDFGEVLKSILGITS